MTKIASDTHKKVGISFEKENLHFDREVDKNGILI